MCYRETPITVGVWVCVWHVCVWCVLSWGLMYPRLVSLGPKDNPELQSLGLYPPVQGLWAGVCFPTWLLC